MPVGMGHFLVRDGVERWPILISISVHPHDENTSGAGKEAIVFTTCDVMPRGAKVGHTVGLMC